MSKEKEEEKVHKYIRENNNRDKNNHNNNSYDNDKSKNNYIGSKNSNMTNSKCYTYWTKR